jgi:hypothetical protein
MRHIALALAILLVGLAPAAAQITTTGPSSGAVTPADMQERLEQQSEELKSRGQTGDRVALVDFAWPQNPEEYRANAKYIVVLIVAVSKNGNELPLKQVYVRANGRTVTLEKIASERSMIPTDSIVASIVGRYREDSFYLAPASAMMSKGQLLVDFAVNRSGFRLYELPGTPPDFVRADRNANPPRGTKPDRKALRAMIEREYPGFRLPDL